MLLGLDVLYDGLLGIYSLTYELRYTRPSVGMTTTFPKKKKIIIFKKKKKIVKFGVIPKEGWARPTIQDIRTLGTFLHNVAQDVLYDGLVV